MSMPSLEARAGSAPLLKWPGGKRALVPALLAHAPASFNRYYEPFFGGGALFFALAPNEAVLGDVNEELINCYQCIQHEPQKLIAALKRKTNTAEDYYAVRASKPRTEISRAARFLYLTRLSFNGIHRVNLRGEFNVPYGHKTHLLPVDPQQLETTSKALRGTILRKGDFETTTIHASEGDFVFFDPPYTVAHANNGFVKYNETIFSWSDQVRLAACAKALAARGCHVLVSNADHASVRALYQGAEEHVIARHSVIAASSVHRRKITESLFVLTRSKT